MPSLPQVYYVTEMEYRNHFEQIYCQAPIITFDNIPVYFKKSDFNHCLYVSSKRNGVKDCFSKNRAERIDWIKETLINSQAELYFGWNRKRKRCDKNRRVSVIYEKFLVIIHIAKKQEGSVRARFVTAYPADESSISKIRKMPKWMK